MIQILKITLPLLLIQVLVQIRNPKLSLIVIQFQISKVVVMSPQIQVNQTIQRNRLLPNRRIPETIDSKRFVVTFKS